MRLIGLILLLAAAVPAHANEEAMRFLAETEASRLEVGLLGLRLYALDADLSDVVPGDHEIAIRARVSTDSNRIVVGGGIDARSLDGLSLGEAQRMAGRVIDRIREHFGQPIGEGSIDSTIEPGAFFEVHAVGFLSLQPPSDLAERVNQMTTVAGGIFWTDAGGEEYATRCFQSLKGPSDRDCDTSPVSE